MKVSIRDENRRLEGRLRNCRLIQLCQRDIPPQYDKDAVYNNLLKGILEPDKGISTRIKKYMALQGKLVVDLGCGSGLDAVDLAEEGAFVTGLDVSDGRLEFNIELMKEKNVSYNLVNGDVCNLPFEPSSFDIVICKHLIEHLPEPEIRIANFLKLLKNDGILYIDYPNKYAIKQILSDDHYKLPFVVLLPRFLAQFIVTKIFRYEKKYSTNVFLSPFFFRKVAEKLGKEHICIYPDIDYLVNKIKTPEHINNPFLKKMVRLAGLCHLNGLCISLLRNRLFQSIIFPNFTVIVFNKPLSGTEKQDSIS